MAAKAYVCVESAVAVFGEVTQKKEWIAIDPLHVTVELEYERIPESIRKEVAEKVKKKVTTPTIWDRRRWFKKGDKPTPQMFPKDLGATLKKIERFDLTKEWDEELRRFIYVNEYGTIRYIDYWEVLEDDSLKDEEAFYKALEEDAEKEEEGRKN